MNKTKILSAGLLLICVFHFQVLFAQNERIEYLTSNPEIKRAMMVASMTGGHYRMAQTGQDTLNLPFFDDFSDMTVWPRQDLWTDSLAFVSPGFAINPPSFGAATFDGLDKEGNPYDNSTVTASGSCDRLTSKPLNLFDDENGLPYVSSDSIFLVFYFQRKGRGDAPETSDSLRLEFYNVVTQTWDPVWRAFGATPADTVFNRVKISIDDVAYRQKGFRFRFTNYGSRTGNLDIWNVDYVSLDKFLPPDYENRPDFAWVYQPFSLISPYSALPWKHYSLLPASQQQSMVKSSAQLTLRNNNLVNAFPISIGGVSIDQYGNPTQIVGGGGSNNIQVPFNTNVNPPASLLTNSFYQDPTTGDRAIFTLKYVLGQTSGGVVDEFPVNDTVRYTQDFFNYYAYDDGSAELGYGVNGIGAKMAYKFDVLQPDTLRAIQFFFTQLGTSVSGQLFTMAVWSGSTTPSGTPIYQKYNQTPNYIDSINGFYTYLTGPVYLPAGTYFFGTIQNAATILNLGLDINTPADQSKKLINTTGNWSTSQLPGMWMIRPVFSSTPIDVGINSPEPGIQGISIYPVPASDILHVNADIRNVGSVRMEVLDMTGRVVLHQDGFTETLNIGFLDYGVYFLRLSDSSSGTVVTTRFIKAE